LPQWPARLSQPIGKQLVQTWASVRITCCPERLPRKRILEPLNDVIKDGSQEDAEQRHAEHAAEYRGAERAAHLGAGAFVDHRGTTRMTANGSDQLSYWAASTRNTSTTAKRKTNMAVLPV